MQQFQLAPTEDMIKSLMEGIPDYDRSAALEVLMNILKISPMKDWMWQASLARFAIGSLPDWKTVVTAENIRSMQPVFNQMKKDNKYLDKDDMDSALIKDNFIYFVEKFNPNFSWFFKDFNGGLN